MAPNSTALASQTAQPQVPPPAQPTPAQQPQAPPADGQETIQGMADRIRTKYPGAYDGKPDDELVHHWIAKYPVYGGRLAPAEKAKLPDVTKSPFDPANKGINPETYSRIYSSYHPAEPAPTGFVDNMIGEAKNVWKGLTAEPEIVPGVEATMAKGKSAMDAAASLKAGNYGDAASHAAGVIPVIGSTIEARTQQAKTDPWGAAGAGLTDVAATAAPFLIDQMLGEGEGGPGIRQRSAEGLAKTTVPQTMSEAKADLKYGHSPERAIVKEGVRNSKQAVAKMEDVGQALDRALTQPKYMGQTVDVEEIIQDRAQAHIQDAKRAGNPGAVKRIEDVRDAMLNEYGNLQKSPRAAAAMKTQLYGDVKFTGSDYDNEVNAFRKDVAAGIRDGVNSVTGPEIPELNQRYGDLAAARDSMQRGELSRAQKGIKERAVSGAAVQGTRKIAQWLGSKYDDPNEIAPAAPAGITKQTPQGTTQPSSAPALPATRTATPANAWLRTTGLPEAPPPPPPAFSGAGRRTLPPSFSLRGTDLQSDIGPEAKTPIPLRETTPLPSSGEVHEMPGEIKQPRGAKPAPVELSPADQEKADRAEMAQLGPRISRLLEQQSGARKAERYGEIGQKLNEAMGRLKELSAKYPKPETEETAAPAEDEKPKSIRSGKETAQSPGEKAGPKESRTPTFDSMPKEHQEWMARWAQEIRHLPQSLREGEMEELERYGQPFDLLKEKIAKRHLAQQNEGQLANP